MSAARVVYVCQRFPWVTQSFTVREVDALREAGLEVEVLSFRRPREDLFDDQAQKLSERTTYLPPPASVDLWRGALRSMLRRPGLSLRWFARALFARGLLHTSLALRARGVLAVVRAQWIAERTEAAELYHADFADEAATAALVLSELVGSRFSFKSHASYNPQLLARKASSATLVVVESEFDRHHYFADLADDRVLICRTGVYETAVRDGLRAPLHVLSVGTLQEKKGHRYLIEAAGLLARRGLDTRVRIVGSGPLEAELRDLAAAVAGKTVTFAPYVTHDVVVALYASHDVFVLPSVVTPSGDRDGLPAVLIEAAAAGCVVVSTPVSGIPELVVDGVSGLLVAPRDSDALAGALERIYREPALAPTLRRGAEGVIRERFDLRRNVQELADRFRYELDGP